MARAIACEGGWAWEARSNPGYACMRRGRKSMIFLANPHWNNFVLGRQWCFPAIATWPFPSHPFCTMLKLNLGIFKQKKRVEIRGKKGGRKQHAGKEKFKGNREKSWINSRLKYPCKWKNLLIALHN